jgi:hypothetical protein
MKGAGSGVVHPSNPHHVFEAHPAWGFSFQGGSFDEPSLIRADTRSLPCAIIRDDI